MPLPVPHLDDRRFEQLVTEGRSLIPHYSREWTNHNPSDPGMTLLELFAWLTEAAFYQLNQIPDTSIEHFLRLIAVCRERVAGQPEAIDQTLARALESIARVNRTVTAADFEVLAQALGEQAGTRLGRTALTLYRDTACAPPDHPEAAPLAALIIVVPDEPDKPTPSPTTALTDTIYHGLTRHRLLTTRLHVVGPEYVGVKVEVTLVRKPGSGLTPSEVAQAIRDFLHPLRGGPEGRGWPFGRTVYYSEMFQRLERMPKVDHVTILRLSRPGGPTAEGEGVAIPPQALVFAAEVTVTVRD
jgi:hypothetical protein